MVWPNIGLQNEQDVIKNDHKHQLTVQLEEVVG